MGKGKTSKAALKKKERIELQKKMDSRIAIVKVANDQADPLDNLPSFRVKTYPSVVVTDYIPPTTNCFYLILNGLKVRFVRGTLWFASGLVNVKLPQASFYLANFGE